MDAVDDTTRNMAVDWIDSLSAGCLWNVQLLQKKYRMNRKTGQRRNVPFRIHRYAEGCPPSCMKAAMDYLISLAPYSGIVFRGEELQGQYRPPKTEWVYDAGGAQNPRGPVSDGTFTLHQDLVDDSERETLPYVSANSCTEEVQSEWHWDEDDIEDLPAPEQGVSWAIRAESRSEDGTLSYVLVKRVAITSHMERTLVADNRTATVYRETWKNLYGEPPHGFTDNTGAAVEAPYPEKAPVGTTVTLQISKNDDCTYDLAANTEVAKPTVAKVTSAHDQYEGQHSLTRDAQEKPLGRAPDAAGGFIHAHSDTLRPDGTYQTQESIEVERPVEQARRVESLTRRGRRVVVTDRNQPAPATFKGIKLGGVVEVVKTKGRLYDNTVTTWDLSKKDTVGVACHDDLFRHQDKTTTSGHGALPSGHVRGGTGGKIMTRSGDIDDEGSITWTDDVTTEQAVQKHRESWTMGLDGLVHEVTDTQVKSPGEKVSASLENIGKAVVNERTPGGRYNVTTTELTPADLKGIGFAHDATVFDHSDTKASLVKKAPSDGSSHPAAGGGKYFTTTYDMTRTGAFRLSEKTVNELTVKKASVEVRRTPKMTFTTTVDRNVAAPGVAPKSVGSVKSDTTPGGRYNVTTTEVAISGGKDYAACASTVVSHEHQTQVAAVGDKPDESDVDAAGNGVHYSKTSRVDDYGIVSTVTTKSTEIPYQDFAVSYTRLPKCIVAQTTYKNGRTTATAPSRPGLSSRHSVNPGGSVDLVTENVTPVEGKDAVSGRCTVFEKQLETQADWPDQNPVSDDPLAAAGKEAGNGHTYAVSERIDQQGIRTVTITDTTELPKPGAQVDVSSTAFAQYLTVTDRNTSEQIASDYAPVRSNDDTSALVSTKYLMNPGGTVTVERQRSLPAKKFWYDPEIRYAKLVHRHLYMRNFTWAELDRKTKEFTDSAVKDLDIWNDAKTPASTFSLSPTCRMNDYRLFDGEVGFDAKWSPDSPGQGQQVNKYHTDKTFTEYATSTRVVGNGSETTVQARKVRRVVGTGPQYWDNLCNQHRACMVGSSFTFTPSTSNFSATIVLKIDEVKVLKTTNGAFTPGDK